MASNSIYPKPELVVRRVGSATAAGGGTVRIPLNKDSFITEHMVRVSVAQSFAGAPTSCLPERFITQVSLETDKGRLVFASGPGIMNVNRFYEAAFAARNVLGTASTSGFSFDLHHENAESIRDWMTGLDAVRLNQIDLVIQFAADADNGFRAGTTPAAAAYTVDVFSVDHPDAAGTTLAAKDHSDPHAGAGEARHYLEEQVVNGTTAGTQAPVRLTVGNMTRGILLVAENMTGGSFVAYRDDLVTNINLTVGGKVRRLTTFLASQDRISIDRGVLSTGIALLDWGDDELSWLDLTSTQEALLSIDTALPGGVTAWRVRVVQDYTRGTA